MEKRSGNGGQKARQDTADQPADALLKALGVDPEVHDAATAAAFRALAEEVIWLRGEQARLSRALEAAELLADRDALCPVFNRRAFERELDREIARAARHGAELCLIYMDLDRFKVVNDRFGHAAGDAALRQVCDIILSQVRQSDIVGRLGGDEIGIILPHAGLADARQKADSLSARIDGMTVSGPDPQGARVSLGASCGVIAWSGQPGAEMLISEADEAMFRAKSARNARGG